jgi:hypothetical protein
MCESDGVSHVLAEQPPNPGTALVGAHALVAVSSQRRVSMPVFILDRLEHPVGRWQTSTAVERLTSRPNRFQLVVAPRDAQIGRPILPARVNGIYPSLLPRNRCPPTEIQRSQTEKYVPVATFRCHLCDDGHASSD